MVVTGDCGTSDHEALALRAGARRRRGGHRPPPGARGAVAPPSRSSTRTAPTIASRSRGWPRAASRSTWRPRCARGCARAATPRPAFDPRDAAGSGRAGHHRRPGAAGRREPHPGRRRACARWRRAGARACAALASVAELDAGAPIDAHDVSFRLTPRLNAPGRLGEAQLALDLLLAADDAEAERAGARRSTRSTASASASRRRSGRGALAAAERAGATRAGHRRGRRGLAPRRRRHRRRQAGRALSAARGGGRLHATGSGAGSVRTTGGFDLHRALAACAAHLEASAATPPPPA